jgi:hypothetical protein
MTLLRVAIRARGMWKRVEIKRKRKNSMLFHLVPGQELHLSQPKPQDGKGIWFFGSATNKKTKIFM